VTADVKPLYARVARNIRPLSEAQDESILVEVGAIYRGIKVTIFRTGCLEYLGPNSFNALVAFECAPATTSAIQPVRF